MKNAIQAIYLIVVLTLFWAAPSCGQSKIKALLLSGQNNHDWKLTTPVIKGILEGTGRFEVDINEKPFALSLKELEPYQVIIHNENEFGAELYTPETLKAMIDFSKELGRGHVIIHAGAVLKDISTKPEFHNLIIGTWGSKTYHGQYHEFEVEITDQQHPITQNLKNFKTTDELWNNVELLTEEGVTVLARAFSTKETGGSGKDEPMVLVKRVGLGRTFYVVLGHDVNSMLNPGFQALVARGTEWAAVEKISGSWDGTQRIYTPENQKNNQ